MSNFGGLDRSFANVADRLNPTRLPRANARTSPREPLVRS